MLYSFKGLTVCCLFLDDEPDDRANHYIIVYGFYSAHIFGLLAELGIYVSRLNSLVFVFISR